MKLGIYATVIAAFAIAASPALKAQDMPEAQDMPNPGKPCKSDREKFCPGLKPGDGKLGPCMKEHAAELSPECTAAAEAGKQAR
ncbi:MAG: cysteine rich repeat-containing protein, partial [Rhodomicrobium sp.]